MTLTGEAKRAYQREWCAKRRAEYLTDKCCVMCGSTQDLEVDHVDRAMKVSHNVWSWSTDRRTAELAKCQVLCHDCHLAKTFSESERTHCVNGHEYAVVGRDRYSSDQGRGKCSECRREWDRKARREGRKR